MGVDTYDRKQLFRDLMQHVGHDIEVSTYGKGSVVVNVALECRTCHTVLLDADAPPGPLLKAPTEWGMFTKQGNRIITNHAQELINRINAARDQDTKLGAVKAFLITVRGLKHRKTTREVTDTAVREALWYFVSSAVYEDMAEEAWRAVWER